MKQLLMITLVLLCIFQLTGCGKNEDPKDDGLQEIEAYATGFQKTITYNPTTKANETVEVKLLELTTDQAPIDEAIAAYNGKYDLSKKEDFCDWLLIVYEARWPIGTVLPEAGYSPRVLCFVTDRQSRKGGRIAFNNTVYSVTIMEIEAPAKPLQAGESGIFKGLVQIPKGIALDDVLVQFGREDLLLINRKGEIFPPAE